MEGRSVFAEIQRFFEAYDYFVKNKRTFVEVKCAVTENGFMGAALPDGSHAPLRITGQGANCWNHELRAMSDAVLVGVGTLLADNPSLDVRFAAGNNPVKVLWAGHRVFTEKDVRGLKFFAAPGAGENTAPAALVYSLVEQPVLESVASPVKDDPASVEIVRLTAGDFAEAWNEMLDDMSRRGMHRLMVEPGATLAGLLFESKVPEGNSLWNRLDLWQSTDPHTEAFLDGDDARDVTGVAFPGVPSGAVARDSAILGPDVLTVYYPQ